MQCNYMPYGHRVKYVRSLKWSRKCSCAVKFAVWGMEKINIKIEEWQRYCCVPKSHTIQIKLCANPFDKRIK